MDNQELGKYQNMMPSRAMLARLSIFGTSAETRESANAILKALPPMNEKERREYLDETWKLASLPPESELEQSPIGKATLEMLRNSKSSEEIRKAEPEAIAPVAREPAPVAAEPAIPPLEPPPGPSDDLAVRLQQQHAEKLEQERTAKPWKWTELKPSNPDKSLRPISDWDNDLDNNRPIY